MKNEVANTILSQLGGNQFIAMTGAWSFSSDKRTLSFRVPKAKNGIRGVIITLQPNDLYQVRFLGMKLKPVIRAYDVSFHNDVYNDKLQEIFTQETGLETKL